MKKFWALLKVSVKSMLITTAGRSRGRRGRAISGVGVIVLIAFLALYMSAMYSSMLLDVLEPANLEYLVFVYMGLGALVGGLLYTVFAVRGMVFGGKDNDLLLALPVSGTTLMISRVLAVYLENLVFAFFVLVPAGVMLLLRGMGGLPLGFWVRLVLAALLLPLLDTALSVVVGAVLAFVSSKISKAGWGQNIFMAVFLVLVFWCSFNLNGILASMAQNVDGLRAGLSWAAPMLWMADGIMGDWLSLLWFALCCVIPFALMAVVLGKCYRRAVTAFQARSARSDYKLSGQRSSGQTRALLRKESRRFFGTPMYFWNSGMGLILLLVLGVLALLQRQRLLSMAAQIPALPVAGAVILFCLSTGCIAAPSVSLEGRYLWILREAPVEAGRLLWVKTGFEMLLALPCALAAVVCMGLALALPLWQWAVLAVAAALFIVIHACLGMLLGLAFPKLDAVNEMVVVKQSMAVMLGMFLPMLAAVLAGVLYGFVGLWAALALLLVLAAATAILLLRRGPDMLRKLT